MVYARGSNLFSDYGAISSSYTHLGYIGYTDHSFIHSCIHSFKDLYSTSLGNYSEVLPTPARFERSYSLVLKPGDRRD